MIVFRLGSMLSQQRHQTRSKAARPPEPGARTLRSAPGSPVAHCQVITISGQEIYPEWAEVTDRRNDLWALPAFKTRYGKGIKLDSKSKEYVRKLVKRFIEKQPVGKRIDGDPTLKDLEQMA
jgi:hypothetical protein